MQVDGDARDKSEPDDLPPNNDPPVTTLMSTPKTMSLVGKTIHSSVPMKHIPKASARQAYSESSTSGPVGISNSARNVRSIHQQVIAGTYQVQDTRRRTFLKKVSELDPDARVMGDNLLHVTHSECGKAIKLETPGDFATFQKHHLSCHNNKLSRRNKHGQAITLFFAKAPPTQPVTSRPVYKVVCTGLTKLNNSRIPSYIKNTAMTSAGGRSYTAIAGELYRKSYARLNASRRTRVDRVQQSSRQWRLDQHTMTVFAMKCSGGALTDIPGDPGTCEECRSVLISPNFRKLLG